MGIGEMGIGGMGIGEMGGHPFRGVYELFRQFQHPP